MTRSGGQSGGRAGDRLGGRPGSAGSDPETKPAPETEPKPGSDPGPGPSPATLHATTVCLNGRAVLIRGASGSGKSGLALRLIGLGAGLVADDRTRLWRDADTIMADAPAAIRGRIEARGVGLLKCPAAGPAPLALIVDLDRSETDRLPPARHEDVMGLPLPVIGKSEQTHFPAAIALYLRYGRSD